MRIFKHNLRLSEPSFQPGTRRTSSPVENLVCAILLTASFILCGSDAKASTNVLVNPGAETGLAGWNISLTGYIYVVNTNQYINNNVAAGHIFVHSGSNEFQLFDTTADSAYIWQDFAAAPGSQWTASCYAICYASNYFNPGATAHLQVSFFDSTGTNLLADSTYEVSGVYGSDILDPVEVGFPFTIVPPLATNASGWLFLSATNFYYSDPASEANYLGMVTEPLIAPTNTASVRYTLRFDNSITDGGDVYWDDCALTKLVGSDPDIFSNPTNVTVWAGLPAQFAVVATKAVKPEVLIYQWQKNGTNLPPGGGVGGIVGGTTNASLFFANCQSVDQATYAVTVTDTNGSIRSVPVTLTVLTLTCDQKANALGANSGFENNPVWQPWNVFNGCYWANSNNVPIYDGNWCALSGWNGDRDNGFWMSVPAAPGTIWKAGAWAYIPSTNDFIGPNTCRLQIWFKDALGNPVAGTPTYESFKIYGTAFTNTDCQFTNIDVSSPNYGQVGYHTFLPKDQWVFLQATNMVNNNGILLQDDLPTNTLPTGCFVVPAGAAQINFQVYEYCPVATDVNQPDLLGGVALDAVWWDNAEIIQILMVTNLTASVSAGHVDLSFYGSGGIDYAVSYKTNLTDPKWNVLANNIPGACTTLTVSDTISAKQRFYRVESK